MFAVAKAWRLCKDARVHKKGKGKFLILNRLTAIMGTGGMLPGDTFVLGFSGMAGNTSKTATFCEIY